MVIPGPHPFSLPCLTWNVKRRKTTYIDIFSLFLNSSNVVPFSIWLRVSEIWTLCFTQWDIHTHTSSWDSLFEPAGPSLNKGTLMNELQPLDHLLVYMRNVPISSLLKCQNHLIHQMPDQGYLCILTGAIFKYTSMVDIIKFPRNHVTTKSENWFPKPMTTHMHMGTHMHVYTSLSLSVCLSFSLSLSLTHTHTHTHTHFSAL